MAALSELSRRDDGPTHGALPPRWAEAVRRRLLAEIEQRSTDFAHNANNFAKLTADSSQDPIGLHRATAALGMYSAIEAIEQLHDALARVKEGRFGTCQSCSQPIPRERLETLPQTRFCAVCSATVDPREQTRRGPFLGEPTGVLPRSSRRLTVQTPDPPVLVESMERHPSSIRYPSSPHDPRPGQHSAGFKEV
jgi:DnaK suppressor protein